MKIVVKQTLFSIVFLITFPWGFSLFAQNEGTSSGGCHGRSCCAGITGALGNIRQPTRRAAEPTPPMPPPHYEIISANAEPAEAKIVGIGEEHNKPIQIQRAIKIINKHAKDGDVVLIEGLEAGKVVDKDDYVATHGIKANVTLMG